MRRGAEEAPGSGRNKTGEGWSRDSERKATIIEEPLISEKTVNGSSTRSAGCRGESYGMLRDMGHGRETWGGSGFDDGS